MEIEITSIHILHTRERCDYVTLNTNLPGTLYPFTDNLCLRFEVHRDGAERYVAQHFQGISVDITYESGSTAVDVTMVK
jgi:hypothetical protein